MTPAAKAFVLLASMALLLAPRRWAPLPLFVAACYLTLGQVVKVGALHFTAIRILIGIGIIRVVLRGERPAGGLSGLGWLMVLWGAWALCSSAFHQMPKEAMTFRLGLVYNTLGIYFLIRCLCHSEEDARGLIKMMAILLIPVAFEMLNEQITHRNLFSIFGGVSEVPAFRNGRCRSQGPFAHAILAGTVGAVSVPLMIGIWRKHRLMAKLGLGACLVMVVTSASSGPLLSLMVSAFALILWHWRHFTRQMQIVAIIGYFLLDLIMNAPAYYLIARIDLTGGSSGWHRARLIESAFKHLGEWWWAGTDYTRHWMPTGVSWSPEHTDITNYYLKMGVIGGLPLMLLFIMAIWMGFRYVGEVLRFREEREEVVLENQFLIWTLGASLLAHAATCISVSYFDQSYLFLYLVLAMIVSVRMTVRARAGGEVPSTVARNLGRRVCGWSEELRLFTRTLDRCR